MCQPGVHGKLCSSCLPQHWDFGADGCKKCECELEGAVGCNVNTGKSLSISTRRILCLASV